MQERQTNSASESADIIEGLDNKKTIAQALSVSPRTIDNWMREKRIPYLRLSPRCIRFDRRAVLRALGTYTVKEAK